MKLPSTWPSMPLIGRPVKREHKIDSGLATINAPRPQLIDAKTFVHCLTTSRLEQRWHPHIEAFFDEVSPEAIHDLVLAGIITFEDLYRAARTWSRPRWCTCALRRPTGSSLVVRIAAIFSKFSYKNVALDRAS